MKYKTHQLENSNGSLAVYCSEASSAKGVLLCVHGGPDGDYTGNEDIFPELAEYSPELGFHCVMFDMFGSGASSGTQRDFDLVTMVEDYKTLVRWAKENYSEPLFIVGESMGATVASLDWQSDITANIWLWPAFDLKNTDLEPYLSDVWITKGEETGYVIDGDFEVGVSFLKQIRKTNFAPCFELPECPNLLIHGRKDSAVPFRQSLKAAEKSKGDVEVHIHPTGDHGLQDKEPRAYTHDRIVQWLKKF